MKRFSGIVVLLFFVLGLAPQGFSAITEVDSLIQLLQEKNIITKEEARELKTEIATDSKTLKEEGLKESLPKWVQDMKLKGDLRLRYQTERRDSTNSRHRGRIRMRLGLDTNVNEKVQVGVGLATGSGDPRSTNETLENSFEKSDIRLDYAYAKYSPTTWVSLWGGKMGSPFWVPKDLLFDSDITYDGGGAQFKSKKFMNDKLEWFFNTGFFVLDEYNGAVAGDDNYDPYMYVVQPGFTLQTTKNTSLKFAGAYYGIDTIKGRPRLAFSSSTNTVTAATTYAHSYDPIGAGMEFAIDNPLSSMGSNLGRQGA